ncbi:MAG: FadR family transcriptional regulator [Candidatus Rokubacteria bacterium]|nr:FadR family transcriptional regulator [Candidatus Rokubacteria bacterium]MBI3825004.1 FadR family transcriptional regulator [Candidatus Rokubacteria bacterium]
MSRRGPRAARGERRADMGIEPVKSTRIYEEIVRQVKAMIAEGRLKSGDRLPPERDLAEKFVVSRTSVREALRALESLGLIEIRAGEGTFVRGGSVEALIEPLALVLLSQREAIGELFEARRLLEPAIAALAARRATPDEVAEMARILEAQAREIAGGGTGLTQDAAFHAAIASAAHNRAITRIVHAIMDLLSQSREESLNTPGRPTRSHQDHRRVLDAITRRDPDEAARAMADHVAAVERLVVTPKRQA